MIYKIFTGQKYFFFISKQMLLHFFHFLIWNDVFSACSHFQFCLPRSRRRLHTTGWRLGAAAASTTFYAGHKFSIPHYLCCGLPAAVAPNRSLAAVFLFDKGNSYFYLSLILPVFLRCHKFSFTFIPSLFMIYAGTPTTVQFSGTSFTTTAFAPALLLFPI